MDDEKGIRTAMKIIIKTVRIATSGVFTPVVFLPLTFETTPFYIDPGTGSLVLQVLVASFLSGLFLIKIFWGKVKAFLQKIFQRTGEGHG